MKTQDGRLYVIGGASRSGKTAWTRKATAKARRVLVWDPEAQWCEIAGFKKITRRADMLKAMAAPGPLKLAYVAGGKLQDEFDFFTGCAYYAGRYVEPITVIAEELADVTTPSKAPGNWGILLRRGLKRGIDIFAISQRWAEADKTAVGNASEFVIFRQSSGDDVAYLSRKTRIPVEEINGLKQFEFVRFDAINGQIDRGKLRF